MNVSCPACDSPLACSQRALGENRDTGGTGTERSYKCDCGYHAVLIVIEKFRQRSQENWTLRRWPGWDSLTHLNQPCCSGQPLLAVPDGVGEHPRPHVCLDCQTVRQF